MTLKQIASERGVSTSLLDAVITVNDSQNMWIDRMLRAHLTSLEQRRICLLGLTYTTNTSTLRRSGSVEAAARLARAGATISAFDPGADQAEVARLGYISRATTPYDAAVDSDAVALVTPWPEFRALDLIRLRKAMRGNLFLDPNGVVNGGAAIGAGFRYVAVGRVDEGQAPQ
jgi:UDPglucose 6-dehydrogenase